MEKIFGSGTKVLIKFLISRINSEFGLNMKPEHFLELMMNSDQHTIEEICSFLSKIAVLHRDKGGVVQ